MAEKSSGSYMAVVWVGLLIAGLVFIVRSPSETEKQLADPEAALRMYLQAAWDHMHADGNRYLNDIQACVTEEDWAWFDNNYRDYGGSDPFGIQTAADPNAARAILKFKVMSRILSGGPHRADTEILSKEVGSDTADFHLKHVGEAGTHWECDVTVVKEGRTWKMKDFGGGRTAITTGRSAIESMFEEMTGEPVSLPRAQAPAATPVATPSATPVDASASPF